MVHTYVCTYSMCVWRNVRTYVCPCVYICSWMPPRLTSVWTLSLKCTDWMTAVRWATVRLLCILLAAWQHRFWRLHLLHVWVCQTVCWMITDWEWPQNILGCTSSCSGLTFNIHYGMYIYILPYRECIRDVYLIILVLNIYWLHTTYIWHKIAWSLQWHRYFNGYIASVKCSTNFISCMHGNNH